MRKERGLTVPDLEPHKMERVALSAAFTKFVSQYIFFSVHTADNRIKKMQEEDTFILCYIPVSPVVFPVMR